MTVKREPAGATTRRAVVRAAFGASVASTVRPGELPSDRSAAQDAGHISTPMLASDFGVVGDGVVDDTKAVQRFLDRCAAAGGRLAHFGGMRVRVTGPLIARGVGVIFDVSSHSGPSAPGFHPTGGRYTVLTVIGSVPDLCCSIIGSERPNIGRGGALGADRRQGINGIAFGDGPDAPFFLSVVRSVRVFGLAGFGARFARCWDSTFQAVSVEECGNVETYAFEVDGDEAGSCNECVWTRVQVESAIGSAVRIDPRTLSCTFDKLHSERCVGVRGVATWALGGSCVFQSVRLTAHNPVVATATIRSNQCVISNLRAEDGVRVSIDASGGSVTLVSPAADLAPVPDQNGQITVMGGQSRLFDLGGGWVVTGTILARVEVGFMPSGLTSFFSGCAIGDLLPAVGATQGDLILSGTTVAGGAVTGAGGSMLRALSLTGGSRLTPSGGHLSCGVQRLTIEAGCAIVGDVSVAGTELRLAGSVEGLLAVTGPPRLLVADSGSAVRVRGTVGPPAVSGRSGDWCKNLSPERTGPGFARAFVGGWRSLGGSWRPVRVVAD